MVITPECMNLVGWKHFNKCFCNLSALLPVDNMVPGHVQIDIRIIFTKQHGLFKKWISCMKNHHVNIWKGLDQPFQARGVTVFN